MLNPIVVKFLSTLIEIYAKKNGVKITYKIIGPNNESIELETK